MVRICVLGAGINGLSAATHIQQTLPHCDVTLISENFSPDTTSDHSAGFFLPITVGEGDIERWGKRTYEYLTELSNGSGGAESGAKLVFGYIIDGTVTYRNWYKYVKCYRTMTSQELDMFPTAKFGVFYMSFILDNIVYLPWLMKRFVANGGNVIERRVESIREVAEHYEVVVNCTGLGSYSLLKDETMQPIKGQMYKVQAPWVKHFVLNYNEDGRVTYIFPGNQHATIGGTFVHDWDQTIKKDVAKSIWDDCLKIMPQLEGAKVIKEIVGLRPYRPSVRLELDYITLDSGNDIPVIHNYGHGGAGVSLFKGCAEDVLEIVKSLPICQTRKQSKL